MKANNTTTNATATATATTIANLLWEGSVVLPHTLSVEIAALVNGLDGDLKGAGAAIGEAWAEIGGNVAPPARLLIEACAETSMTRKEISKLANATGIVTKQRWGQLLLVILDGDKSKNNGNKPKGEGKGEGEGEGESQEGLDQSAPTVDAILALVAKLPALSQADAIRLAKAIDAKVSA
jgi:hypothetical protein